MDTNPYIQRQTEAPPVILWYKVYAGLMTLMYAACIIGSGALIYFSTETSGTESTELLINGIVLVVIGLPLTIACVLPFLFGRKPWVWIYNLVIIALGLTSCCCIPVCVPLLIYWLKPETKIWYGRTP